MRVLKKYVFLLLFVTAVAVFLPFRSLAADGEIQFSDPTGKVGENVEVSFLIKAGAAIGEASGTLSYDSQALEFVSGDSFTAQSAGVLAFSGSGNGTDLELRKTITFRALKQTTTTITVGSMSAKLVSGEDLNLVNGSSSVTIEPGEGGITQAEPKGSGASAQPAAVSADDLSVTVDGKEYSFSDHFAVEDLPEGFSEGSVDYNGTQKRVGVNSANVQLAYLIEKTEGGVGAFFVYEQDTKTFLPFVQLKISDETTIVPLNEPDAVKLPESYQQTELSIGEHTYPVWSDPQNGENYYILYALNIRTGQKGLYRYDTEDGTYQSFAAPVQEKKEEEKSSDGNLLSKLKEHFEAVLAGSAVAGLILFVLMIVFGVKLARRNKELDDLYNEYDFSDGEDDEMEYTGRLSENTEQDRYEDEYSDDEYEDAYDDEYEDEYEDGYDDEYENGYDDEYFDAEYENGDNVEKVYDDGTDSEDDSFFDEDFDEDFDDADDDDFDVMDLFDDEPKGRKAKGRRRK